VTLKNSPRILQVLFGVGFGGGDAVKRFVEEGDDALLFGEWGDGNLNLKQIRFNQAWDRCPAVVQTEIVGEAVVMEKFRVKPSFGRETKRGINVPEFTFCKYGCVDSSFTANDCCACVAKKFFGIAHYFSGAAENRILTIRGFNTVLVFPVFDF
jgi:hypothetical protein